MTLNLKNLIMIELEFDSFGYTMAKRGDRHGYCTTAERLDWACHSRYRPVGSARPRWGRMRQLLSRDERAGLASIASIVRFKKKALS